MTEHDKDEQFYRDTESIAFPKLDDRQLAMLEPLGRGGSCVGARSSSGRASAISGMTVVLSGELEVFEVARRSRTDPRDAGPRDFVGDVAMLNGTSTWPTRGAKAEESEVLEVPAVELRRALAELPGVGEPIVSAFIMRRERLQRDREFAGLRIVAQGGSREGSCLHDFLDKNHIPHRLIDSESEDGRPSGARLNLGTPRSADA